MFTHPPDPGNFPVIAQFIIVGAIVFAIISLVRGVTGHRRSSWRRRGDGTGWLFALFMVGGLFFLFNVYPSHRSNHMGPEMSFDSGQFDEGPKAPSKPAKKQSRQVASKKDEPKAEAMQLRMQRDGRMVLKARDQDGNSVTLDTGDETSKYEMPAIEIVTGQSVSQSLDAGQWIVTADPQSTVGPPVVAATPPAIPATPVAQANSKPAAEAKADKNTDKKADNAKKESDVAAAPKGDTAKGDAAARVAAKPASDVTVEETAVKTSGRPDWIDRPAGKVGDVYLTKASVGPYATRKECEAELNEQLKKVVQQYIEDSQFEGPYAWVSVPISYIRQNIVKEIYEEVVQASVGPMLHLHARLEFDMPVQKELQDRRREKVVAERLTITGIGSSIVAMILGTVFGYLKIDTATRGRYTNRLRFAAGGLLATLVVTLGLLVTAF